MENRDDDNFIADYLNSDEEDSSFFEEFKEFRGVCSIKNLTAQSTSSQLIIGLIQAQNKAKLMRAYRQEPSFVEYGRNSLLAAL